VSQPKDFFFNEVSGRSGDKIKICGSLHSIISTVPKAKAISMAETLTAHFKDEKTEVQFNVNRHHLHGGSPHF